MFTDQILSINDKTGGQELRVSPMLASVLWLGLSFAVAIAGFFTGVPATVVGATLALVSLPSIVHLIIGTRAAREAHDIWIVFAWIIVGLICVLMTGGASSPLVVMLALGPLHALSLGRFRLGIEASIFAGIGYLSIAAISFSGAAMPSLENAGALIGLGALVSVLQVGVFAASAGGVINERRGKNQEIDRWVATLTDTPVLVISLDPRRKVRSWVGDLRLLPGMSADEIGHASMADFFEAPYDAIRGIEEDDVPELKVETQDNVHVDLRATRDGYRLVLTQYKPRAVKPAEPVVAVEAAPEPEVLPAEPDAPRLSDEAVWIASLGHELRNMLNPVSGYSDLILSERAGPVTEPYKGFARSIKQGAEHLGLLVDDLMTAAKGRSGRLRLEPEDLDVVMEAEDALDLIRWQAEEAGMTLKLDAPQDGVPVHADRKAMRQIFLNLLSNAVKYSPPRGQVSLTVTTDDTFATVAVSDEGDGISEAELARLGEPFFQGENARHRPGTGLGLSIVMMLSEALGGDVHFESAEGEGTTARVRLPLKVEDAEADEGEGEAEDEA